MKQKVIYTMTLHLVRKKFKLTIIEYAVMDTIYRLSVHHANKVPGWCYMSKLNIAEFFDIGRATVFRILDRLRKKGLVVRNSKGYLRPTDKWIEAVEPFIERQWEQGIEMRPLESQNDTVRVSKRDANGLNLRHNNNKDSNRDNDKDRVERVGSSPLGTFEKKGETVASKLIKNLHSLTGKGVMNKVREASIVTMLLKKGYKVEELEGAIEWGVKEKGLMNMKQLPDVADWYLGYLKREPIRRRREMEELGPGGREALEIMREM